MACFFVIQEQLFISTTFGSEGGAYQQGWLIGRRHLFCHLWHASLSVTAIQECCVKKSLCQSQDCGTLVLLKVKSILQISI